MLIAPRAYAPAMTDSTWIGVTANLTAPAYHLHDEVRVPLSRDVEGPTTRFGRDDGGFAWNITYRRPQCSCVMVVEADVALSVEGRPQPDEVAWHHGPGPE